MPNEEVDIKFLQATVEKYNVSSVDVILAQSLLQISGFGRNQNTANLLRCIADMIEYMNHFYSNTEGNNEVKY